MLEFILHLVIIFLMWCIVAVILGGLIWMVWEFREYLYREDREKKDWIWRNIR